MSINLAENKEKSSEIWKDVVGYEGLYQVSSEGRVRSLDRVDSVGRFLIGRIMKQDKNKSGYYYITLSKNGKQKGFRVHRLVAYAFINNQNPEKLDMVDHKNGVRDDNRVENLRWIDNRENTVDGFRRKDTSSNYEGVHWKKLICKWCSQISFDKKCYHLGYFNNEKEAYKAYLIALEKGQQILDDKQTDEEKMKAIVYYKEDDSYRFRVALSGFIFNTQKIKTLEEVLRVKQEILKDFSNINNYRKKSYNLKEELSKLDINKLKKHKHYESFKHLL